MAAFFFILSLAIYFVIYLAIYPAFFYFVFCLSVPFITKTVDLVRKLGQILIGSAFISLNHSQQPLACRKQTVKDRISGSADGSGSNLLLIRNSSDRKSVV